MALAMLLGLTLSCSAETQDWPEPLAEAIVAMASVSGDYAYTREAWDEIGHYVERFDPSKPRAEQWQLVLFDDQKPTEKHRARYLKEYEKLFEREHPAKVDLTGLVDRKSLRVIETTPDTIVYGFKPLTDEPDDEKMMANLNGTLVLDVKKNQVTAVELNNDKKFSPAAMVSIKEFSLAMRFDEMSSQGPVSLVESTINIRGRFMGLKKVEQSEKVEFREFIATPES